MASPSVSIPTPTAPTASGGNPQSRKPNFDSTRIVHHDDGSHTVFHENSDPSRNVSYAVSDLAGVHAGLAEQLKQVARSGTAATLDPDH